MNRIKIFVIILAFVIIISVFFLSIYLKSNTSNKGQEGNAISNLERPISSEKYTRLNEKNITSITPLRAKKVEYYYDDINDTTYVRVNVENTSGKTASNSAICLISFYDKNDKLLEKFGGIIESNNDIENGRTITINTQFKKEPGKVEKATIDFEKLFYLEDAVTILSGDALGSGNSLRRVSNRDSRF